MNYLNNLTSARPSSSNILIAQFETIIGQCDAKFFKFNLIIIIKFFVI